MLVFILGWTGMMIVALCLAVLFVRHRVQRHNRVDPKVATPAPVTWLADPRAPARLHRRLARVGRTAAAVADHHRIPAKKLRKPGEQPQLVLLAEDLRRQAVNLDLQLARVAHLPASARRTRLSELSAAVTSAESACLQLHSISEHTSAVPVLTTEDADITNVAAQLERLAEAHRVLHQIDADAGLASGTMTPVTRT